MREPQSCTLDHLKEPQQQLLQVGRLKGYGRAMKELMHRLQLIAPSCLNVLILGETGVGKELCAQSIQELSPQAKGQFIKVNCAAIPQALLLAELFGSEGHAYTNAAQRKGLIASAHEGTLFLDEIGELSLEAQAALLRVLESGELRPLGSDRTKKVKFRLISATHKNLANKVKKGLFREDLYHRITGTILQLPALRERTHDLLLLIKEFDINVATRLSPQALQSLQDYAWPGNIRELKNKILGLAVEKPHGYIHTADLKLPAAGPWCSLTLPQQIESSTQQPLQPSVLNSHQQISSVSSFYAQDDPSLSEKTVLDAQEDKFLITGPPKPRGRELFLTPFALTTTAHKSSFPPSPPFPPLPPTAHTPQTPSTRKKEEAHVLLTLSLKHLTKEAKNAQNISAPYHHLDRLPILTLKHFKTYYILYVFEHCEGCIAETARVLDISRNMIYRVLDEERKRQAKGRECEQQQISMRYQKAS